MTSVFTRKSGRVSGQISVLAEGPKEKKRKFFLYFRFYPETFFSHCRALYGAHSTGGVMCLYAKVGVTLYRGYVELTQGFVCVWGGATYRCRMLHFWHPVPRIISCQAVPRTVSCQAVPRTVSCQAVPYRIMPGCTVSYHIMPGCTVPYHARLYRTV